MAGDAIFLIKDGGGLVQMDSKQYESESLLQGLLADYPDLLAGGQINASAPRRWLLVGREVGVPAAEGGSDQWSADHLFLDQDAIPTIVEVKRSTDTRIRREVVGQMLDYAANGVRYWPVGELRDAFDRTTAERQKSLPEDQRKTADMELAEFLGDGADLEGFWAKVAENLKTGRIRLLFVADEIPAELQRVVEFLNEQMTDTEVYAVEIKQYTDKDAGMRTLVPRLLGATVAAQEVKGQRPRATFAELLAKAEPDVQETDRRLQDLVKRNGFRTITNPQSRAINSADDRLRLMEFYPAYRFLTFFLGRIREVGKAKDADAIHQALNHVAGKPLSEKNPNVPCSGLIAHWNTFEKEVLPLYVAARQAAGELTGFASQY